MPCLYSYAFSDGKKRSVILINSDVERRLPSTLKLPSEPADDQVRRLQVNGPDFASNNEVEPGDAKIALTNTKAGGFKNGYALNLPPCSTTALSWNVK